MSIEDTLREVIEPYISDCRYLKEAELDCNGEFPKAIGKFEIPRSFYCIKTGHFNAVEAMICYNQLAYTMFGECSQKGMIGSHEPMSLEKFKSLQIVSYIVKIKELIFKKPINPQHFHGKIELLRASNISNNLFLCTKFEFADDGEGFASGKALLAVSLENIANHNL